MVKSDWREKALIVAVIWGVTLTLITETLSLFNMLNRVGLLFAWGICVAVFVLYLRRSAVFRRGTTCHDRIECLIILSITISILVTAVTALIAPPNTWDSMTYHMSRVAHWTQNESINHYPASDLRQLYQHPFAEFAITHLQIITGGDRFANMVQWAAMVGSVIGVSAIAALWTDDKRTQLMASVLCVTIPMGVLQASGSQNDYVTAFWLVCLAFFITKMSVNANSQSTAKYVVVPLPQWTELALIGASLGLMVLTKATTYIYASPFVLWLVWILWRQHKIAIFRHLLPIIGIALVIVAPHFARNYTVFGSPLGPHVESYTNDVFTPQALTSNLIRNTALHIVLPDKLRTSVENMIDSAHNFLNMDVNDPQTTFPEQTFNLPSWTMHEDLAPSPLHLGLLGIAIMVMGYKSAKSRQMQKGTIFFACVVLAYALFCLVLRWQPWNARLHLPFWVILAPFTAMFIPKRAQYAVMFVLLASAIFPLTMNANRALIGDKNNIFTTDRTTLYFAGMPNGMQPIYEEAVKQVVESSCENIGLAIGSEGEYPLWVLLDAERIEHVYTPYLRTDFVPCAIIGASGITGGALIVHDVLFERVWNEGVLAVFMAQ